MFGDRGKLACDGEAGSSCSSNGNERARESKRLMALEALQILNTLPEEAYDRIVRRVSQFFSVPICVISFMDHDAQWFKAKIGVEIQSTPRESSFSQAALEADGVFVVEDTHDCARFANHPAVCGEPGIRFYAGIALAVEHDQKIGILCVVDTQPRVFDGAARAALEDFAAIAVDELHLRLRTRRLEAELLARREAEAAALLAQKERADFLAMVTHELRTPLNAIVGIASMMCQCDAELPDLPGATALLESAEHLTRQLNEVLDLARIEANGFTFRREPFDLRRELRCALDVFRPQAAAKGVALALHVDAATPALVLGDRTRVAQVLLNLLSNALKFTARGGITVTAIVRPGYEKDGEIAIDVIDTGIGMDAHAALELGSQFVQAGPEIRTGYGGTGLGLAVCRRLVQGMGGSLDVESTLDVGTRIGFTVPCGLPPCHELDDARALEPAAALRRGDHLVLVADDDAVSRKIVVAMLARLGYRVEACASGRAALVALRERPFDVAILDMQMPDLDGISLARELHMQSEFGATVPLIALTGQSRPDDARIERLFNAYLVKPASASALDNVIATILARRDCVVPRTRPESLA
ncbi:hybrid sensor histidine kinase/response regulator [Burkholderia gladioli]|uniref:hybrid sensor histidine kinase/response regulator n=1 Tax=Burkholderia gladioli TaxID=28095 RepID=UPI00139B3175|nr:ATP-binding protein [Burkholderia gladioli]KAF1058644.1 Autoinducer 2 sensor kinase/phosphatase LuxQ [Burkholderia gladioli]